VHDDRAIEALDRDGHVVGDTVAAALEHDVGEDRGDGGGEVREPRLGNAALGREGNHAPTRDHDPVHIRHRLALSGSHH